MEAATLTIGSQQCTGCTRAWASSGHDAACPYCGEEQRPGARDAPVDHRLAPEEIDLLAGPTPPTPEHRLDGDRRIVTFCEVCDCTVVPMRNGTCGWCCTPLEDVLP